MFPDAGFRVLDQAELDRVRAVVIDAVAVEQVGVGEGVVTGRAVRAVDAVPAVSAVGAADRPPTRLVPRHFGRLRPAEPWARVREDGQGCVPVAHRVRTLGCRERKGLSRTDRILTRRNKYEPYRGGRGQECSQENDHEYQSADAAPLA